MEMYRVLKEGMSGDDVKEVQNKLINNDVFKYHKVTGYYGSLTTESVIEYQKKENLYIDGIVGENTWLCLFGSTENEKNSKFEYTPSMVITDELDIYKHSLKDGEYVDSESNKTSIYLHHTSGGSRPDWTIDGWNSDGNNGRPYRVGTSYIIGRRGSYDGDESFDGKVFKAFDDEYWAFHLGVSGTNGKYDKSSIGIEMCNYGYCTLKKGKFYNYINREIPSEEVVDLGKEFRGHQYWERYTDIQIENLRKLLIYLIDKHDITYEKGIYDWEWFDYNYDKLDEDGIKTHVQVRRDKTDMFPQKELIDMLNSL